VDLPEFLLARIAEDQRLADEANSTDPGPWRAEQAVPFPGGRADGYVETARTVRSRAGNDEPDTLWDVEENAVTSLSVAQHMARHDPARVLAECAAKQAIVELHRHEEASSHVPRYEDDEPFGCVICAQPTGSWITWPEGWCLTLRLLAQPFADRPDFDPSWRV
jgi:hypothetical protein